MTQEGRNGRRRQAGKRQTLSTTRGRDALARYIAADESRSQRKLARTIGVGQQSISLWLRGYNRPCYAHMLCLQMATGIAPDSWLDPEERTTLALVRSKSKFCGKANGRPVEARG